MKMITSEHLSTTVHSPWCLLAPVFLQLPKGFTEKSMAPQNSCITSSVVSDSKKHRFTSLAISIITRLPIISDCTPRLECFWVKTIEKPHLICESDWFPAQADTVWAQTPGMWAAAGSTTRDLPSCYHRRCLPCCNKRSEGTQCLRSEAHTVETATAPSNGFRNSSKKHTFLLQ